MVDTKQTERKVIRDELKESRGDYYVVYHPADSRSQFANLHLVFPSDNIVVQDVIHRMEVECTSWLKKYCVPVMVTSFDAKDNVINLKSIKKESYLLGFVDSKTRNIVRRWESVTQDEFLSDHVDYHYLERVYSGVPFRYLDEHVDKARSEARVRGRVLKLFKLGMLLFVVFPVLIEIISLGVAWLGHLLAAISILTGLYKISKAVGWVKPSLHEQEEAEKQRKMEHYYHHCELNPNGFRELVSKNFERETIEETRKEAELLKRREKETRILNS